MKSQQQRQPPPPPPPPPKHKNDDSQTLSFDFKTKENRPLLLSIPIPKTKTTTTRKRKYGNDENITTQQQQQQQQDEFKKMLDSTTTVDATTFYTYNDNTNNDHYHSWFLPMRTVESSYQIMNQIGTGAFSSVYIAKDITTETTPKTSDDNDNNNNNHMVALKRINTNQERYGFPIPAIREIKILQLLQHHINIVHFKEVVTTSSSSSHSSSFLDQNNKEHFPQSIFMVLEYAKYDLLQLLQASSLFSSSSSLLLLKEQQQRQQQQSFISFQITQNHIQSWSEQLLEGCHYMYTQKVLHRDLKPSNILIDPITGILKIADFGLARIVIPWKQEQNVDHSYNICNNKDEQQEEELKHHQHHHQQQRTYMNTNTNTHHHHHHCQVSSSSSRSLSLLTNPVVTLWYRPPEILLGSTNYTSKIDMWSIGCILIELVHRTPFFKGTDSVHQLYCIFQKLCYCCCGGESESNNDDDSRHDCCWLDDNDTISNIIMSNMDLQCYQYWKTTMQFKMQKFHKQQQLQPKQSQQQQQQTQQTKHIEEALKSNIMSHHHRHHHCHHVPDYHSDEWMTKEFVQLITKLLEINPEKRWSAREALNADYFFLREN